MRRELQRRKLLFAPGRPAIGLHVRRGDLHPGDARATPNEYYYDLIDCLLMWLPNADVHIWSSLESYSYDKSRNITWWTKADFDGFAKRGVAVHLDDSSLVEPWAHLSSAEVLVMSLSSFSYVPAAINPHCVISPGGDK